MAVLTLPWEVEAKVSSTTYRRGTITVTMVTSTEDGRRRKTVDLRRNLLTTAAPVRNLFETSS